MTKTPYLQTAHDGDIKLDRIDLKILAALQGDGRITNLRLADIVGLSATPCLQRVRRLEKAGYIRRYEAVLDLQRLYPHFVAFIQIQVASQRLEDIRQLERFIRSCPSIVECHRIGSGFDYLIKSVNADMCQLQELVDDLLSDEFKTTHVSSYLALRSIKQGRSVPIEMLSKHSLANPVYVPAA